MDPSERHDERDDFGGVDVFMSPYGDTSINLNVFCMAIECCKESHIWIKTMDLNITLHGLNHGFYIQFLGFTHGFSYKIPWLKPCFLFFCLL